MKVYIMALATLLLAACSTPQQGRFDHGNQAQAQAPTQTVEPEYSPLPGSNEMLRSPITLADGLEVIISDVVIPPNATVPRHYHPGEEFIYVIEGSAIHMEEGKADLPLKAGETYVIPPEAKHSARGGAEGARAIVFRVHVEGEDERIPVEEE